MLDAHELGRLRGALADRRWAAAPHTTMLAQGAQPR
jgi:hypothetical protein